MKLKYLIKSNIGNQYKLIYMPLLIGLIAILTVSVTSYYISKNLLLNQMKQDGINLAKVTERKINTHIEAMKIIETLIEDKIRVVGKSVIARRDNLSNDLLNEIANEFNIDEIYWYNPLGEIIYSATESYLGWTITEGHPVENFKFSEKNEHIEDIRKDSDSDMYYKYGYLRVEDGSFVQLGIEASEIEELIQELDYQNVVEDLAKEDSIVYALIINAELQAIADSDIEDIGIIYSEDHDYKNVLNGNISVFEWYYTKTDEIVLEVAVPVLNNDVIIGIVSIGLSMENVNSSIYFISLVSSIITIIMVLLFLWSQNKNIIKPARQLNQNIKLIDLENNMGYRLPLVKKDTFYGLSYSINSILEKIDIYFSKLKIQEAYIEHIASHDSLTNLPNRRTFMKNLEESLNTHQSGAVMLIDLDNFKEINDSLGHVFGDKVLKNLADMLISIKDEKLFISRFGGDEFLVLISGEDNLDKIEIYAKKIMNLFKNKIVVESNKVYINCSMGISLYSPTCSDANQLIMNADLAMYHVKGLEKNNYMFFNENMMERFNEKLQLENMLREVVKKNDFKLLYQPQVSTSTGKIGSFEALLRIKNNYLSPDQFIPVAEDTGMIVEIGRWVTEEVIKQLSLWKNKGLHLKPIAINFSAKQLKDLGYIEFLETKLKENDVEAKYVEIEITETLFLEKEEKTIAFLKQLKALGVKIALDDFGTGYSSLSYLTFLPVDKIKLDKSLSDKYLESKNVKVINGIISLAHSLNLLVVAEGIEDMKQYELLKMGRCNYIQGYLLSRPLDTTDAEKVYDNNFLEKLN